VVYVVADSTVVLRSVTPGLTASGQIEIVDGLEVGERVVTLGANLLRDGAKIRDVSDRRAEGAPAGMGGLPSTGRPGAPTGAGAPPTEGRPAAANGAEARVPTTTATANGSSR
jgi:multidrug efflux system membrane fusion protein